MIRRIVYSYLCNNRDKLCDNRSITVYSSTNQRLSQRYVLKVIEELVNVFNDNLAVKTLAGAILNHLINYGIKIYMKRFYNEKEQSNIIELIFNKIILKKFVEEYPI